MASQPCAALSAETHKRVTHVGDVWPPMSTAAAAARAIAFGTKIQPSSRRYVVTFEFSIGAARCVGVLRLRIYIMYEWTRCVCVVLSQRRIRS